MKGFDCSTPLTAKTAAAFAAAGYAFVGRYLVPANYKKAMTKAESRLINQAGIDIISVFETTANRALGGRTAGLNDGYTAVEVAKQVGQPEGSTIYTAVDFDVTAAQMPIVLEYIKGFSEATPRYNTGVYGSYTVINAAMAERVCSRFWQTYAWSRGKKANKIHIYQYKNDITENGIGVDLNEGYEGLGSWNALRVEEEELMLNKEDANKVIGVLSAVYGLCVDQASKDEVHRLANELRKVSGQPEE
ncbi:DUF1906 domain-containing protein [Bacillus sp. 3255]|uniref:DUF1906 domain-containing protein n=1 Tax=Bacillus sp. 3255 TaxID=2817904 RepID=UPI00285E8167|nr:DUF1906 domain-containing protein [Bacillus sp. 3255]MDR6883005.1 hypothetical protein [Bacillus sp. 3255]